MEFEHQTKPHTKWTIEVMAGAVYALKDFGKPVNPRYLSVNHPNLYNAMAGYPGGWNYVVQEAGFVPEEEKITNPVKPSATYDTSY